ncbi:MAG TPA: penicillin-insensitive murein endopeptidase [Polyangiaceae bacterium]
MGGVALRERAELRQVTNSEVGVQNIFVADSLKRRLLEYARRHRANLDVLYRAEAAMRQPTRGAPHDDHFHVRIACPPASVRATLCISEPEAAQRPLRDRTAALDPTER